MATSSSVPGSSQAAPSPSVYRIELTPEQQASVQAKVSSLSLALPFTGALLVPRLLQPSSVIGLGLPRPSRKVASLGYLFTDVASSVFSSRMKRVLVHSWHAPRYLQAPASSTSLLGTHSLTLSPLTRSITSRSFQLPCPFQDYPWSSVICSLSWPHLLVGQFVLQQFLRYRHRGFRYSP